MSGDLTIGGALSITGGNEEMKLDMRRALLCSLCLALFLSLALATGRNPALAQGKPAPGPNQAFLYEMSENAVLLNAAGHPLVPDPTGQSPTGLIDALTGDVTIPAVIPARRVATSELQGVAAFPSPLCPVAALITIPKLKECTVTATGHSDVSLATGMGTFSGTNATVIQLDNSIDSPEWGLQMGSFYGGLSFQPPLGFSTDAFLKIGGSVDDAKLCHENNGGTNCIPFNATFRQPFAMSANGHHVKPRRGQDAFYLRDNGKLQPVRQDERAVGWPTVRFEINF